MTTDEEKLLAILSQPDLQETLDQAASEVVDEELGKLGETQRATLQALLEGALPTPEEIERDAKMAAHNAEIQQRREERLAKRREKQARSEKNRRRRG